MLTFIPGPSFLSSTRWLFLGSGCVFQVDVQMVSSVEKLTRISYLHVAVAEMCHLEQEELRGSASSCHEDSTYKHLQCKGFTKGDR